MVKAKRIGILSFAKLHALIGALVGLILGVIYSFGGLLIDAGVTLGWITSQETPGLSYGTVLAFGALIGMPIIFAMLGLLFGTIAAILYNIYTRKFKPVDVEIEE